MVIRNFSLNEIEITDSYLKNAFRLEQEYLLSLDPDRLLAGFYETAGKNPKGERYPGGWEDQDIAGHTMGHYLTALSQVVAATGEERFLERLRYLVDSLEECQTYSGYLSAFSEDLFDYLEEGKPAWVPWYTMHKILSGLISAYQLAGIPSALSVAIRLGNWVSGRVNRWDDAMKARVLATEYGGMNDCMYELYKESGKIEFMMAAEKFDEIPLFREIHDGKDILEGKHANATIPKFLGALNRYLTVGENQKFYLDAAKKFFDIVVENHTYVTGGNSEWEHFGPSKLLAGNRTNCNCETCNTYNMLKLARGLFLVTGDKKYMDFYEGTFWNAIVSSQNPKTGMSTYFQPMATGYFKVFGRPYDNFWCCTGTGMENFTKLNDSIYFKRDNVVYVGMYISSELTDDTIGIRMRVTANLPADPVVKVAIDKKFEGDTVIAFRRPEWNKDAFLVTESGQRVGEEDMDGFWYVIIEQGKTELEVHFTPKVMIHSLTDDPNTVAFTYGHLVLSAGLGTEEMVTSVTGVNVAVPTRELRIKDTLYIGCGTVEEWKQEPEKTLIRQGNTLNFKLSGTDEDSHLMFSPHYARFEERYGIYWKLDQGKGQENRMPEETREKKKNGKGLMIGLIVLVVILLLITGFFVALEISPGLRARLTGNAEVWNPNSGQEAVTPTPVVDAEGNVVTEPTAVPVSEDKKYLTDLEQVAAAANTQNLYGFTAFVEQIGGKQYLSFSNGVYKVSYKNDYTTYSSVPAHEVIVSNGSRSESFYWDYALESETVAGLVPRIGDYCGNGRMQLAFSFKETPDSAHDTLHVVAGNTLLEYYCIAPDAALQEFITINGYLDAGQKTIVDLTSDNRNYYVALPECELELAKEVYDLKANSHLTYEITDKGIVMQSFVELGDGQFIGRIRGNVTFSSRDVFRLVSPSFYLFAEDDFSDVDSMGISEPVTEEELYITRIPVVGDGGERILVRAKDEIAKHSYDLESFRKDENGFLAYYENGVKKTLTGVDVSKWQNDINWSKVKAAGVDYAIIRLGFRGTAQAGNCAMDSKFVENIEGALAAGLQVGVYYYTQAVTVEEAIEEANIVIESLKGYNITFPVVYDTEYAENARANGISNSERTACAKAFCDTILAAGYTPVVYASTNWCVLDLDLEELQNYDFWYAYYGDAKGMYFPYNFTMWQYTDSGRVDGIPTEVDLNISFMDYSTR